MRKTLLLLIPVALLAGCSYGIKLDAAGKQVRTAWNDDVSHCQDLGKVTVSVLDHVGPVNRNTITVRDELEVLARNEAAGMHADTIKPLAEPRDGSQPWGAYRCGKSTGVSPPATKTPPAAGSGDGFQTYPMKSN